MAKKPTKAHVLKREKPSELSELERDLTPVLTEGTHFPEVAKLLSQLSANEKHILVTSYPACNAGVE